MENSYFSEEHGIHQIKVNKPQKKSVSIPTFIISLIMVAALVIIIFLKRDDIMWFFWIEQEIEDTEVSKWLSVWDEVKFSGSIRADWDMENYTHSYVSSEYWVIGLKSKIVTLSDYSDNVYFEWVVEKIYREMPIVLVTTIYSMEFEDIENTWEDTQTWENMESLDKYLPSLWLYFGEDFFKKYSLVNEWDGSYLKIKNLDTNIIYSINYFKCDTKAQSSENCEYLRDFYSTTNISLVDKYGVSYYKDAESTSRFFSNDSTFGYKVSNEDESFIRDLSTLMTVVNKKYVEKNVLSNISKLCTLWHASIQTVKDSNLAYKNGEFWYYVTGSDANENIITCELKINPMLSNNAQVTNIEIIDSQAWSIDEDKNEETEKKDDKAEEEKKEESAKIWDPNVEQFPINLEKKLTFTSSRWHSFVFPSSNIAYQWVSAGEDFGQVWVNCFSAMNVVKYADKEFVETDPNVIIYECTVKNSFNDSDNTLIYKKIWDKHFVIKIVDPAWVDFANNIEIIA